MDELGVSINIALPRIVPEELRIVTVPMTWAGKVIWISRPGLSNSENHQYCNGSGTYILVGPPEKDSPAELKVYAGSTENLLERVQYHDSPAGDKPWWEYAILCTTTDPSMRPEAARYLEDLMIQGLRNSKRFEVESEKKPRSRITPAEVQWQIKDYFTKLKQILPILGITLFESYEQAAPREFEGEEAIGSFEMKVKGATAYAVEQQGKFVVLAGSTTVIEPRRSASDRLKLLREQLVIEKVIQKKKDGTYYVFTRNHPFNSSSAAASVIAFGSEDGNIKWRVKGSKRTYGEYREGKFSKAPEPTQRAKKKQNQIAIGDIES